MENTPETTPTQPTHITLKGAYGNLPFVRNPGLGIGVLFGAFFALMVIVSIGVGIFMFATGDVQLSAKGLRIITVIQDVFVFVIPAVIAAIVVTRLPANLLAITAKPRFTSIVMALVILGVSMPAMEYIISLNQSLPLPDSLGWLEDLIRKMEDDAANAVNALAGGTSVGDLIMGVLIVGVLTGFSEEIFFRGAMLNLFLSTRMRKHLCVWLVAIIFSFMHFQFYGFVPRILMGAYFGYLIWWTGSLWVPVIAHAFNNSLVVVIQWISARKGIDYSEGEALANYSGVDYLIIAASVALTVYCMKLLYDATHAKA